MTTKPKSVLITGVSSGIGEAIAEQLVGQGWAVTGLSRRVPSSALALKAHWPMDLAEPAALARVLKAKTDQFDTLVLAAGFGRFASLEEFSFAQIQRMLDTNLTANLFLLRHFLASMKQQRSGDVVFVTSEAGLSGARYGVVYSATKFALRGVAQSLRAELRNNNIRVMSCAPGPVDTAFFDPLNFTPVDDRSFYLDAKDVANAVVSSLNQPRHVVTEEIVIQPLKRSFAKKPAHDHDKVP